MRLLLAMTGAIALLAITADVFAADDLADLQATFLRKEYGQVVTKTEALLSHPGSISQDDLLYLRGVSALKLRDFDLARTSLEKLLADFPNSRWFPQSSLALGDTAAAAGDSEKAAVLYQKLLSDDRAKSLASQISFRLGQVQRDLGLWDKAKDSLQQVADKAPNSSEAVQAKELLQQGDFYFSVQVGAFSSKTNAQRLKSELDRRSLNAEVNEAVMQGRKFYRVWVGRFSSRQEAQQQEQRLRASGFPAKVVP